MYFKMGKVIFQLEFQTGNFIGKAKNRKVKKQSS